MLVIQPIHSLIHSRSALSPYLPMVNTPQSMDHSPPGAPHDQWAGLVGHSSTSSRQTYFHQFAMLTGMGSFELVVGMSWCGGILLA